MKTVLDSLGTDLDIRNGSVRIRRNREFTELE